uniref:Uncharacterized protein n=1 Tax=Setaria italica TaxID=4555 RepID=K4AM42_SETIT
MWRSSSAVEPRRRHDHDHAPRPPPHARFTSSEFSPSPPPKLHSPPLSSAVHGSSGGGLTNPRPPLPPAPSSGTTGELPRTGLLFHHRPPKRNPESTAENFMYELVTEPKGQQEQQEDSVQGPEEPSAKQQKEGKPQSIISNFKIMQCS